MDETCPLCTKGRGEGGAATSGARPRSVRATSASSSAASCVDSPTPGCTSAARTYGGGGGVGTVRRRVWERGRGGGGRGDRVPGQPPGARAVRAPQRAHRGERARRHLGLDGRSCVAPAEVSVGHGLACATVRAVRGRRGARPALRRGGELEVLRRRRRPISRRPRAQRTRGAGVVRVPQPPSGVPPPPPPSPPPDFRTNRTRRVLHPVLIGHAASFTPY